ncbi:MAG: hypothetical protein HYY10_03465 [Candidatus Liptonbacteria bacterium]|nr:hypothetical protein [Candidatus Liptonbacteria bacterium]
MKLKQAKSFLCGMSKYLAAYTFSVKEVFYYPRKLQVTAIIVPFRILIMLVIYSYAFQYLGTTINGIDAKIAVWSIAVYHILLFTQFRGIFKTINEEIRRGHLDTQLNKPYHYLIYKFWEQLGKGLPNFIVGVITVVPLLYMLTGGFPHISLFGFLSALVLIIGGTLVSAAVYILIVLPALWIDDAVPLYWVVDKAILILGGSYIPLVLLPPPFQLFANLTPFGAPMFATQMFNPGFSSYWAGLLLTQIAWIGILLLLIYSVFSAARKRLSINGG